MSLDQISHFMTANGSTAGVLLLGLTVFGAFLIFNWPKSETK